MRNIKGYTEHIKESIYSSIFSYVKHMDARELESCLRNGEQNVNARDDFKETPLHRVKDLVCAEILVRYGAEVNATSESGETPLHTLMGLNSGEKYDIAVYLMENGADPTIRDNSGISPLNLLLLDFSQDQEDDEGFHWDEQHYEAEETVMKMIDLGADVLDFDGLKQLERFFKNTGTDWLDSSSRRSLAAKDFSKRAFDV